MLLHGKRPETSADRNLAVVDNVCMVVDSEGDSHHCHYLPSHTDLKQTQRRPKLSSRREPGINVSGVITFYEKFD